MSMLFAEDTYFDETIDTSEGPVRVFAETCIFGTHLILDQLMFFPLQQSEPLRIGVAKVLAIGRSIREAAKQAGFTAITLGYHRIGSRRTGNTIVHTRTLP